MRPTQIRFSVEHWAAFWANPHPTLAGRLVTPDVIGHWPGAAEPTRGVTQYQRRIADVLNMVPDIRLAVAEHADNGDATFIRWIAHGTGADGRFELHGVSCFHLRDGLVKENYVYYDHMLFDALVSGRKSCA